MKGRSSLLEQCVPYSRRCPASGENALSKGREDRVGTPRGGWEPGVDQPG